MKEQTAGKTNTKLKSRTDVKWGAKGSARETGLVGKWKESVLRFTRSWKSIDSVEAVVNTLFSGKKVYLAPNSSFFPNSRISFLQFQIPPPLFPSLRIHLHQRELSTWQKRDRAQELLQLAGEAAILNWSEQHTAYPALLPTLPHFTCEITEFWEGQELVSRTAIKMTVPQHCKRAPLGRIFVFFLFK